MRTTTLLVLLLCLQFCTQAQTVTGSWYGNADVMLQGRHNNYLTELIIKQKGDEVVGILGYYFKNGYQSVYIHGNYDKSSKVITIDNVPITYFRAKDIDGVNCYMDFTGRLMISQVKTTLNGYFTSDPKYKYTCPELKVIFDLDSTENKKQDSLIKNTVARKFWQPLPSDVIVDNDTPVSKTDNTVATNTPVKKDAVVVGTIVTAAPAATTAVVAQTPAVKKDQPAFDHDSVINMNSSTVKTQTPSTAPPIAIVAAAPTETQTMVNALVKRKNLYSDVIVNADSIRVSFYDNGEIDGDSISVFLNKQPIVVKQGLDATALNIYIKLDDTKDVNELTMFAENLGKYPPNTALMVIFDGVNRQEVYLSSSLTQNATVRIRRKK